MTEETPVFDLDSSLFNDYPLADVYYAVRNELKERDPAKKSRAAHHRIALWSAWEAHKTAKDNSGLDLLKMVGLPSKQKEFAELLGVSARTIRKYQDEYAEFARTGQEMTFARLLGRYRLGAVEALGQVVTDLGHSQFAQSQRTFFTMTGDLKTGPTGTEDDPVHSVGMTVEEWKQKAAERRQQAAETAALFEDDDTDVDTEN